jgi:hypothetical protein
MITKLSVLASATAFAGAALYINMVEQPARLTLDNASALKQWKQSYSRAMPMQVRILVWVGEKFLENLQAGLAALSGIMGAAVAYKSGDKTWLIGTGLMLANWPFTVFFVKVIDWQKGLDRHYSL